MKRSAYIQKRAELEKQLKESQASTDAIQRRIDALDIVWHEVLGNDCPAPPDVAHPDESSSTQIIDSIALAMDKPFGAQEVIDCAATRNVELNRTTVAGRLKTLATMGKLVLTKQGVGRRASVYTRPEQTSASENGNGHMPEAASVN